MKQRKLSEQATKGKELLRDVHKVSLHLNVCGGLGRFSDSPQELANATSTLRADVHSTKDLKTRADQCVQDTIVAIRILDGHRNAQNGAYLKNHATFPLEFFDRITVQMRERLHWYKTMIEVRRFWHPCNFPSVNTLPSKSNGNSLRLPHRRNILPNVCRFLSIRKMPPTIHTFCSDYLHTTGAI